MKLNILVAIVLLIGLAVDIANAMEGRPAKHSSVIMGDITTALWFGASCAFEYAANVWRDIARKLS